MAAKDDLGRAGEDRAAEHLSARGYSIVDRNWRCALGELDIVATRGRQLCFVEVKTRSSTAFGHPFDAVDSRKHQRLWRLGNAWAHAHTEVATGREWQIDVVAVLTSAGQDMTLEHFEDVR